MDAVTRTKIEDIINDVLPLGAGAGPLTSARLRFALEQVATVAFRQGESHALMSLITAEQAAERLGVSARRMRAIIAHRNERFGIGMKVGNTWMVREQDLDILKPGPSHRPKGESRNSSKTTTEEMHDV